MAMHHTEELKEVIQVVFDQFVGLKIHVDHAGFILDYKEREDMHIWLTDHQQGVPTEISIPYFDSPHWNSYREAKAKQESFFANLLPFEVKNKFYKDLFELIPELTEEAQQAIFSKPALAISTVLLDNVGLYIEHYSETPFSGEENAILMRFGKVFQQTYTRFLDLQKAEAQAREAKIENALEKVRSRTMAMQHSEELAETSIEMFRQTQALGMRPWACGFNIFEKDEKAVTQWMSGGDGSLSTPFTTPLTEDPFFIRIYEARQRREELFVMESRGHELEETYKYMFGLPAAKKALGDILAIGFEMPKFQISHCAFFSQGYLMFITYEPYPEAHDIFRRFAKVFEQTYTRFLDLQKAEAQAREAQIEAALEKVRSRSLAMHRSDELKEVVSVLFERLKELQIPFTAIGIATRIEDSKDLNAFVCGDNADGLVITNYRLPYFENQIPKDFYNALEKQLDFFVGHYSKEEKDAFYNYVIENTAEFRHLPEDIKRMIFDSTNYTISTVAVKNAAFNVNDFEGKVLAEEEVEIIQRFARVFDQAYTRFLDLQKAEAQTRESQIQLSLERIRAKAMAMQHSDELSGFLTVLFEQFNVLNLNPVNCHLNFLDIENNRNIFRITGKRGAALIATQEIDLDASPLWKKRKEDWKAGHPNDVDVLHVPYENHQEINVIFEELLSKLPKEDRPLPEDFPDGLYVIDGYCRYGYLGYSARKPPSDEEKEITRRIAHEFGNVYQRFLDLEKAEAQVREAQIQLSLERIRAKAMSMQHSDELSDFLTVVFEQFHVLNLRPVNSQLSFLDFENNRSIFRLTGKNGATLIATQEVDLDASPVWKQKVEEFKAGQPNAVDVLFFSVEMLPQIVEMFKEILEKLPEDDRPTPEDYPNGQYLVEGSFKYGYLGYSTSRPPTEEEKEITRRITHEFGNVYQRFLDLQKAEAQARESQIQLAMERVRARTMAMQHSSELGETSALLFQQIQNLGVPPWSCGFNIWEQGDSVFTSYMGSPDGAILDGFKIPLTEDATFIHFQESRDRGDKLFVDVLEGETLEAHYSYFLSLPEIKKAFEKRAQAGEYRPTFQINHLANFSHGNLMFITYEPCPQAHDIFIRFAKVFEQTYTRFLDLQKAEAQAREAQIENALEKVRSRTMAMQRSDELTDVAGLLFNQVSALGIKTWTAGFNVWSEDNNSYVDYLSLNGEIYGPNTVHTEKAEALMDLSNIRKSGVEFGVLYVEGEKIRQLYLAVSGIDEKEYDIMVKDGLLPSQQYEHFVFGAKVSVMFITYEPVPEAHDIFKRLGKVFEQTYTRFLDLQKAEAQAREAKIEAALEKVRSRTMGMQSSDELPEVANLLFTEVRSLGIPAWSCGYNILAEDKKTATAWMSSEGIMQTPFQLRLFGEASFDEMGEFILSDHTMFVQELGGKALEDHYAYMKTFPDLKYTFENIEAKGISLPTYQINHLCKFTQRISPVHHL
jgi:hypothetical protein